MLKYLTNIENKSYITIIFSCQLLSFFTQVLGAVLMNELAVLRMYSPGFSMLFKWCGAFFMRCVKGLFTYVFVFAVFAYGGVGGLGERLAGVEELL